MQLPPILSTSTLFLLEHVNKQKSCGTSVIKMLDMFWGDGADRINYFVELEQQMRIEDPWYLAVLNQCRQGDLKHDMCPVS